MYSSNQRPEALFHTVAQGTGTTVLVPSYHIAINTRERKTGYIIGLPIMNAMLGKGLERWTGIKKQDIYFRYDTLT